MLANQHDDRHFARVGLGHAPKGRMIGGLDAWR
jgi:hypothetical protein